MSAQAQVVAIGPFSKDLTEHPGLLEYPASFYEGVPNGYPILVRLTGCCTTSSSRNLALALGVEFDNFASHCFAGPFIREIDFDKVAEAVEELGVVLDMDYNPEFPEMAKILQKKGFVFFFEPNC